jgi:hypothetical protein
MSSHLRRVAVDATRHTALRALSRGATILVVVGVVAGCGGQSALGPASGAGAGQVRTSPVTPQAPETSTVPMPPVGETRADADDAATGTVAPPGTTNLTDQVLVEEQEVLDEVGWTDEVEVLGDVTVAVVEVVEFEAKARVAGEIGGPAVAVTVSLNNDSGATLDGNQVTVTASDGDDRPLLPLSAEPSDPFEGDLPDGRSARAVYLFSLPDGTQIPITITINPSPEAPVAVFVGALS